MPRICACYWASNISRLANQSHGYTESQPVFPADIFKLFSKFIETYGIGGNKYYPALYRAFFSARADSHFKGLASQYRRLF